MADKQNHDNHDDDDDDVNKSGSNYNKGQKEIYKKDNNSKQNDNIIIIKSNKSIINNNISNTNINNNNNTTNVYRDSKNNIDEQENIIVTIPGSVEPSENEAIEDKLIEAATCSSSSRVTTTSSQKLKRTLLINDAGATALIVQETPSNSKFVTQKQRKIKETTPFLEIHNTNNKFTRQNINKTKSANEDHISNMSSLSSTRMKQNIEMSTSGIPCATKIKISATSLIEYQEQQIMNNLYNESHSNSCNIDSNQNDTNEQSRIATKVFAESIVREQNENAMTNNNNNCCAFAVNTNPSLNTNDTKSLSFNARAIGTTSMNSVGSIICRICHNNDPPERLISPCLCKGTLAYVHRYCLEHWLSRAGILHCELCMYRFRTEHTLRYGCWESIRIWFRHPNNRGLLQSDFLVCSLLTIVTFGLITISAFGLQNFLRQSNHIGLSKFWTQGSIFIFLFIVMSAYGVNVYMIIKGQTLPWFRWWQSARHVRLILTDYPPAERVQNDQRLAQRRLLDNPVQQPPTIITIPEEPPIRMESHHQQLYT